MTNIINRSKKIVLTILIIQVIFAIINISHASDTSLSISNIFESGDNFLETGKDWTIFKKQVGTDDMKNIVNVIYSILFPLGIAITVIVGGVLGIKFMLASVEDKAKIKESLIPYIAGCAVIYGAIGIWSLVVNIGGNVVEIGDGSIPNDIYYSEEGFSSDAQISSAYQYVKEGKLDPKILSHAQIAALYYYYSADGEGNIFDHLWYFCTQEGWSVEEVVEAMPTVKRTIYNAAKEKGMIDPGNGRILTKYHDKYYK